MCVCFFFSCKPPGLWEEAKARVQQKKLVVSFTFPRILAPSSAAADNLKEVRVCICVLWAWWMWVIVCRCVCLCACVPVCVCAWLDLLLSTLLLLPAAAAAASWLKLTVLVRSEMSCTTTVHMSHWYGSIRYIRC